MLANGALSGEGTELEIRKQLIENNLVEAVVILPRNLFYTTDISVTLWILNKNKKSRMVEQNGKIKNYRNREDEVLFMDLRQMDSPFEKKYIELTQEDRDKVHQFSTHGSRLAKMKHTKMYQNSATVQVKKKLQKKAATLFQAAI